MEKQKNKRKSIRDIFKKLMLYFIDNSLQLIETLILVLCVVAPLLFNVEEMFGQYLKENYLTPDNAIQYMLINKGKYAIAIGLFVLGLYFIRKHNKEVLMNRGNVYHNYPYVWYWYCAKILGIKKCNLVLVPIFMQFKLVIQSVFVEYPFEESTYPTDEEKTEINISKTNWTSNPTEINILLEDTYLISDQQIPSAKKKLPTVKISRNDGESVERRFSQKYIENVINEVRGLHQGAKVNVFATTNPMNTYNIAKRAFTNATRGNIARLYVYQQEGSNNRLFMQEGKKIF